MARQGVVLLGATGSIGASTLKVLRKHRDRLRLVGAACHRNVAALEAIAREFEVPVVALGDPSAAQAFSVPGTRLLTGEEGLCELARLPGARTVLLAIVGVTGLRPALAAVEAGKILALASKEVLVLGGELVMAAARQHGARILPVDSEHNGVFQCLEGQPREHLAKVYLTASGGPFRTLSAAELTRVTPQQALQHPNWTMGAKVTIDSATLANKGLELIEAKWLFDLAPEQLGVVVHPESLVHALVQWRDGSVTAQIGPADMTFPIQHCLLHPERATPPVEPLDWAEARSLNFEPPDTTRFPCLRLATEVMAAGGILPGVFNAANEVAVEAFLNGKLAFSGIPCVIETTLRDFPAEPAPTVDGLLEADYEARQRAREALRTRAPSNR